MCECDALGHHRSLFGRGRFEQTGYLSGPVDGQSHFVQLGPAAPVCFGEHRVYLLTAEAAVLVERRRHLFDGRLVTAREGNTIHLKRGGLLMAEETFEQFQRRLAKTQQEGRRKRMDEAPPPGMRPERLNSSRARSAEAAAHDHRAIPGQRSGRHLD
jgi:hypothetical protein